MLLEELTDVITRPGFSERLSRIGKSAREVLADYLEILELVEQIENPRIVSCKMFVAKTLAQS